MQVTNRAKKNLGKAWLSDLRLRAKTEKLPNELLYLVERHAVEYPCREIREKDIFDALILSKKAIIKDNSDGNNDRLMFFVDDPAPDIPAGRKALEIGIRFEVLGPTLSRGTVVHAWRDGSPRPCCVKDKTVKCPFENGKSLRNL